MIIKSTQGISEVQLGSKTKVADGVDGASIFDKRSRNNVPTAPPQATQSNAKPNCFGVRVIDAGIATTTLDCVPPKPKHGEGHVYKGILDKRQLERYFT